MTNKEILPLTPVQKTIYINCQKLQDPELYHNQTILKVRGPLELDTLEKAWNSLLKKHPTMTHTFHIQGSEIFQRKNEISYQKIPVFDEVEFYPELARKRTVTLNLEKAPLVYLLLMCKNNNEFKIALGFHHIVLDGFSNRVLWNDLFRTYHTNITSPVTVNNSFYQFIEKDLQSKHIAFKQNQESNIDQIFLNHYRKKSTPFQLQENFNVSSTLAKRVLDSCKQHRCTPAIFFITTWIYCLSRLSSKREINFAIVSDGRDADIQNIDTSIGMFIKALPVYLNWDHSTCVNDLIQKIQESLMDARSNQFSKNAFKIPLDTLVSVVSYDPENFLSFPFPNFQISFEKEFDKSHDPLVLNINVHRKHISFQIAALNSHFTQSSLKILRKAFSNLMESFIEGDLKSRFLKDTNITSKEEIEDILQLSYSPAHTKTYSVQDLLSSNIKKNGNRIAVSDGIDKMTYQELEILSNRLANHLVTKGITHKKTVALISMRGKKAIVVMTALWKVGACFVPIDVSVPEERFRFILQQLNPSVMIYTDKQEMFPAHNSTCLMIHYDDAIDCSSKFNPRSDVSALKAYLIFSSGSSGTPKSTEINHQSLNQLMRAWQNTYSILNSPIRLLQIGSFGFDVFVGDWLKVLLSHGTMFIIPEKIRYSPKDILESIFQNKIDVFESTPSFVKSILKLSEQNPHFIESLKLIILGSEACYVSEAYKLYRQVGKNLSIVNGYGLTEAAIESSVFKFTSTKFRANRVSFFTCWDTSSGSGSLCVRS